MPVHDWTLVDAGLFHAFHQQWISALCDALNTGGLPSDHFALPENIGGSIPDVLLTRLAEADLYARKADRVTVHHDRHGDVVAVVEIVSPGNKASQAEFRAFIRKSAKLLRDGVHLLIVDLLPPGKRDPQGIHKALWDQFQDEEEAPPKEQSLTLASYDAGSPKAAYVNFVAVGETLPDMPLFLRPAYYVPAPLEATYQTTWNVFPAPMKRLLTPTQGR